MARRVVWSLVVVVVLAGVAVVADVVVRQQTEQRIAADVAAAFDLAAPPHVEVGGTAILPQLASGEIGAVRLEADEATVGQVPLRDVVVDLEGVEVQAPHTTRQVQFRGVVSPDALTMFEGADIRLGDGQVVVVADLFGAELTVRATPVAQGRAVHVRLDSLEVAGAEVAAADLPAPVTALLERIRIEIDALPEGMVLDSVTVLDSGFAITASGADVAMR